MRPYIKLYRDIAESELYRSEKFTRMQAFIDLLLLATHKENPVRIKGTIIHLKSGELCYSQLSLADRWRVNPKTVSSILSDLQSSGMIEFKGNRVTTIISIKKYWSEGSEEDLPEGENTGDEIGQATDDQKGDELVTTSETKSVTNMVTINDDDNELKTFIDILIETELKKRKIPIRKEDLIKGVRKFWNEMGEETVIEVFERVLWVHDHKRPLKNFLAYLLVSLRGEK